jgi:hypothetical protein
MKRFEYMEFYYTDKYCMKQLKSLGMEGWEAVGSFNGCAAFLFKRELPDEPSQVRPHQASGVEYSR